MPAVDDPAARRRRQKRRRKVRRRIIRGLLIVGGLVVIVGAFTTYQAVKAQAAMDRAEQSLDVLTNRAAAGDPGGARSALFDAQEATLSARRNTSGPVWWLAGKVPIIGDDVSAARTAIDISDDVTQGVLPDLVDASESLAPEALQPQDAPIDVEAIAGVTPRLVAANQRLADETARAQAIDTTSLLPQVADAVDKLTTRLTDAHVVTKRVSLAAQLLPSMLGQDGPRTYLLMFQNNAEVRATGGIPGALAVITADDGRIELTEQSDLSTLRPFDKPVLPLEKSEVSLFTANLATFPADVTFTPDFPRSAELLQEMWRRQTGEEVDGVMSIDPIALSYLLRGTGPISVPGGQTLTASNAVDELLHQVYLDEPDPDDQNAVFAAAAKSVFNAVTSGRGSAQVMFDGLLEGAQQDRLLIWSADHSEQSILETTDLAGQIDSDTASTPDLGVYLNDGTGAKMDYYLDYGVDVTSESCTSAGQQELTVAITLTSKAPADARDLPIPIRGRGFGSPPGHILTNVLLYAPVGATISHPLYDDKKSFFQPADHADHPVAGQSIDLGPGQTHRLTYTVTTADAQRGTADVKITPGFPGAGKVTVARSAC